MKRIYNKLKKLFPSNHIVIKEELRYYQHSKEDTIEYSVYISSNTIWKHGWSDEFKTLADLETHLKEVVPNYK